MRALATMEPTPTEATRERSSRGSRPRSAPGRTWSEPRLLAEGAETTTGGPWRIQRGRGSGEGFGGASNLRVHGKTHADFDASSDPSKLKTTQGKGCGDACEKSNCLHVTGPLVTTFKATITTTLPSAADFPDLTPCQRTAVQKFIDTTLKAHEAEHAKAFRQYDGKVTQQVDLTGCAADVTQKLKDMQDAVDVPRQASANAASAALDPFDVPIPGLDCDDKKSAERDSPAPEPAPPETEPTEAVV